MKRTEVHIDIVEDEDKDDIDLEFTIKVDDEVKSEGYIIPIWPLRLNQEPRKEWCLVIDGRTITEQTIWLNAFYALVDEIERLVPRL